MEGIVGHIWLLARRRITRGRLDCTVSVLLWCVLDSPIWLWKLYTFRIVTGIYQWRLMESVIPYASQFLDSDIYHVTANGDGRARTRSCLNIARPHIDYQTHNVGNFRRSRSDLTFICTP